MSKTHVKLGNIYFTKLKFGILRLLLYLDGLVMWRISKSEDVLKECGLHTISEYIKVRREMIPVYVVECSIFLDCMDSEQKRGLVPRQWWWEQEMVIDAPMMQLDRRVTSPFGIHYSQVN